MQSGGFVSDILQYVELHLWANSQCKKAFDDFNDANNADVQFNEDGLEICAYDEVLEILWVIYLCIF